MIGDILNLERNIPDSVAMGVLSGKYSVHGGVIRGAGGQIVRHLVPAVTSPLNPLGMLSAPFDIVNTFQLRDIAKTTQELVSMSQATMAMSGLNLAVSAVGFAALYSSLKNVESQIRDIDKKVVWIKNFLDTSRRASLLFAAEELSSLPADLAHRTHILHSSRDSLGQTAMHYLEHLDQSTDLLEAMSYQHFYCTAFLMKARCSAELEMYDKSVSEIETGRKAWSERSRRIATEMIIKDDPERFLGKNYVEILPSAKIAGWMDFAHDEKRGYGWVDSLRSGFSEPSFSWLRSFFSEGLDQKEKDLVSYMDNLVSRNEVLDGYESQYRFLMDNSITPSRFDAEVHQLPLEDAVDGIFILAPETKVAA
ncbi:MAG: hypothetical protein V7720_01670 [Halioglobus sp.]